MRLLLRSNSHRTLGNAGLELASSPDTVGRERWLWHLRLDAPQAGHVADTVVATAQTELVRGDGHTSTLSLDLDPARIAGQLETLEVSSSVVLERKQRQMVVLVAGHGPVLVEGRHLLAELDVLVLEGDDPYTVSLEQAGDLSACLGVARLDPVDATRIAWVP